jgi:hypothetical protein
MSTRQLDTAGGASGGAVRLTQDPQKARNIHVTVLNPTAAAHAAFFGRSQREVSSPSPAFGNPGFAIVAVPNTVVNQTVGGVSYTSFILLGWVGELWAVCDAANTISVEVFDSGWPEK